MAMTMLQAALTFFADKMRTLLSILGYIMDLLIDHGADYEAWLEEGFYPEPSPGPSVKTLYFDNENSELGINYNAVQHMRRFLQTFEEKRLISPCVSPVAYIILHTPLPGSSKQV